MQFSQALGQCAFRPVQYKKCAYTAPAWRLISGCQHTSPQKEPPTFQRNHAHLPGSSSWQGTNADTSSLPACQTALQAWPAGFFSPPPFPFSLPTKVLTRGTGLVTSRPYQPWIRRHAVTMEVMDSFSWTPSHKDPHWSPWPNITRPPYCGQISYNLATVSYVNPESTHTWL